MKTISQIADKVACGGDISANLGKLGCLSLFGTPDNLLAIKRGTKIPANTVFNLTYLLTLIKSGVIIPLIGSSSFEDVSAEDGYSTNAKGIKRLNLKGLPEYKLMYEEGHEFYKNLDKLEGYKNFDYIIGDDDGNWMVSTNSDGSYGGMSAGHTTPEMTTRKVPGGDAESKSVLIQFLDRLQFDRNYSILHQEDLTFSPSDVPLVNGVNLTFSAVPVAASAAIDVAVVLSQDNSTAVEGLTEWIVSVNGTTQVPTVTGNTNPNDYKLTITPVLASTDVILVYLGLGALTVTDVSGTLFRSIVLEDTIA
jgi:hypothetical protein